MTGFRNNMQFQKIPLHRGSLKFRGGGGGGEVTKAKTFKESMKLNWNFQGVCVHVCVGKGVGNGGGGG